MALIKHAKGNRSKFQGKTYDSDTIYFIEDEKKIQLGENDYTGSIKDADDVKDALGIVNESTGNFLRKDGEWAPPGVTGISVNNGAYQTGTVSLDAIPTVSSTSNNEIATFNTSGTLKKSNTTITTTAPTSSSNDTTVPTSKAVDSAISSAIGNLAGALIYKGTLAGGSTGSYGALTPAGVVGDTYKVSSNGKIDGVAVETGDTIICVTATAAATSSNYTTTIANWNIIQKNEDGVVSGPASATDERIAVFNGTTGKVIKDGGKKISEINTHRVIKANGTAVVPGDSSVTAVNFIDGTNVHITNSGETITINAIDTTYEAGTGLSLSSTTINHSNSVTAKSTQAIYPIAYDAQGHITGSGSAVTPVEKVDGITGSTVTRLGTCSTAASTAAKTVSITSGTFTLEEGARVTVKFSSGNTASSPTLNVNSKGAKNIFHKGSQITTGDNKALLAGVCDFVYDGTQWHLVGNYLDTNTQAVTSVCGQTGAVTTDQVKTAIGVVSTNNTPGLATSTMLDALTWG